MITEENKFLGLEEIKLLLEKVYAAQQAGNHVIFRHSNYSTEVIAMEGEISEEKEWDKQFEIETYASDIMQKYNACIAYLEKLAGEKHDN
ncbi:Uncharacterised protein [Anaerobutyricum hallii]|uniref:Uncharacterized protein n=1 Tax=Anaerobutyricum hallii TaxID=39488 RepID=A0A174K4B8_9FIRM|nr:hypothetical protein [Anaerobutyricum hallii]GFO91640.1 hypothetical protein ANHA31_19470 [Anaerobutyricum hallii]CUP07003.1 Uncharacterised protein [Anaerobutyricum hallii]